MQKLILNDGHKMPIVGFGTYKSTEQVGINAIKNAFENGYTLLDTAAIYGNEKEVGKAIIESGIPRDTVQVTSKLWRENLSYKETKLALEKSLKDLQLTYLDQYLIHWPANAKNFTDWQKTNADTWRAMEELQQEGKIKSIGVSNFWPEHLEELLQTAKTKPALNQIEFHPGYWQPAVVSYCKQQQITIQAWSPLARGRVFQNELLNSLAVKHNKTVSQICLKWITQHQVIVIPKSSKPDRIKENISLFDFTLTNEEMEAINNLPEMGFSGELPNIWPDRMPV